MMPLTRPSRAGYESCGRRSAYPLSNGYFRYMQNHFGQLQMLGQDRYAPRYGFWRPYFTDVIYRYLECGDLHFGFARVKCHVEISAYCLMPNHVHLIAVPETEDGLRRGIGEAHRRYTRRINFRENWRGHLWQGRFSSFPMDQTYLLAAARYVENNPVRANLASEPALWPWSSARARLAKQDDALVKVAPLLEMVGSWKNFLAEEEGESLNAIRKHARLGRPLGTAKYIDKLELELGRTLTPKRPGPKGPRN